MRRNFSKNHIETVLAAGYFFLAIVILTLPASLNATGLPQNARWSPIIPLPLVPVAAANLPDGRIAFWASLSGTDYTITSTDNFPQDNSTATTIFDPNNNTNNGIVYSNSNHDMFCPGTANLADGKIFVNGGKSNVNTSIYDSTTATWSSSGNMAIGRGYQGDTLSQDGSVLTVGGSWSGDINQRKDAEVWSAGTWRMLPNLVLDDTFNAASFAQKYHDNHMWLFSMSNGRILHLGPGIQMHWLDIVGDGAVEPIGPRGNDTSALNGAVAMYDADKILKVGGAQDYERASPATNTAYAINLTTDGAVAVTQVMSMAYPRTLTHAVVLPTGEVVVVGGATSAQLFTDNNAVLAPEIWNPSTQTFSVLPPMQIARNYHSVALLLPDARVLVGGGGLGPESAANHPNVEILSPPYLFNNNGTPATRPVLNSAPSTATHGSTISVTGTTDISSFSIVRMSSETHSVNNDQRRVPLSFSNLGSGTFNVNVPSNRNIVLPGYYMLFAMNAAGTPSISKIIKIGAALPATKQIQAPDRYVWRFYSAPGARPDIRSAYYYMTTTTPVEPTPPAGFVRDTTTTTFMFRAWSTSGDGRVPISRCRSSGGLYWIGNGCSGDTAEATVFYAYPNPLRGSTKVLHYVSTVWGGKLVMPYSAQTKAQIDAIDANSSNDPWTPWINRSPNDRLAPFYVAASVEQPDLYVWRFFSHTGAPGDRDTVWSDYAYVVTTTSTPPNPPDNTYVLDPTTTTLAGSYIFRAWSKPGPQRVPIYNCYGGGGKHWIGNGCVTDASNGVLFYAYPADAFNSSVKALHYLNTQWGGKLIIPFFSGTELQINGLNAANPPWQPYIDISHEIGGLYPFWVAAPFY